MVWSVLLIFFSFVLWSRVCLFSFCVLYPVLPVSLDYPFLVAPSVFSNILLYTRLYKRFSHTVTDSITFCYLNHTLDD